MTHTPPSPFDRFAIVPLLSAGPAPSDAIVVGPYNEMMEYLPQSVARAEAEERLEQARLKADEITQAQTATRALQVAAFCDAVNRLTGRLDALIVRRTEQALRDAEAAARAEREAQEREDPITLPPGETLTHLPDDAPAPPPSGELHELAAKEEPEPALEISSELETDDMGGVPLSYKKVPTSYVRGAPRDTAGDLPEELSDPPDPVPEPRGSVIQPPVGGFPSVVGHTLRLLMSRLLMSRWITRMKWAFPLCPSRRRDKD
jgi:hypothetical protein